MKYDPEGWMTVQEIEQSRGTPREVTQILSRERVHLPADADRQARRRVILAWWAEQWGQPLFPVPRDANGEPMLPQQLVDLIVKGPDGPPVVGPALNGGAAIYAYVQMLPANLPDAEAAVEVLASDLADGPPTAAWVADEYARFNRDSSCPIRRYRPRDFGSQN